MTAAGRVKPRIEIAPGADPAGDLSLYAWESAGKRRAKVDIVIGAGRDDEAEEVEAGSFSATFDNRDGNLSPRNILGKWYGQLGRGTPLRVLLDRAADPFTRNVSGSWGTSPDGFAWSNSNGSGTYGVNGSQATAALPVNNATRAVLTDAGSPDVEVTWSTTLDVMPTGANFVSSALLRHTDVSNFIHPHIELAPDGSIGVKIQRVWKGDTDDLFAYTTTAVTYSAGTKVWGKARADGPYIMVKAWTGAVTDEPDTWQAATVDDTVEGVGTGLYLWRINTNVGTYTAKVDDFELVNILWSGNVPEWSPKWPEKSGADSTLPVVGAGILRRLAQGSSPVKSPLRNQLGGRDSFTYYPLEAASGAQEAGEANGGPPAGIKGITFGSDDTLNGSAPTAVLDTQLGSIIQFKIASTPTPDGWAALWFFKMSALPSITTEMVSIRCSGTMQRWALTVDNTTVSWKGYDYQGNQIADAGSAWAVDPTQWVAMQVETNVSGGTTEVALIWHQVGDDTFFLTTDTYSGTSTKPDSFVMIGGSDNMSIAHLWFGDNDLPFVDVTFMLVSDGYRTEEAADRIRRLCAENGVPAYVLSGDSEPMGRQRAQKLVDLLRECEAADQGILCERGNALMYIPRLRRYNVPVSMALDWSLGHLKEAPEPTDDDQRFRNQWTVSRTDGSSVTVVDQDSIDKSGTYDDSVEVNIAYDSRLVDFAAWFLNRDTADVLRWPRITIDLIAHPELIPAWLACRVGSRITVSNPPSAQLAGEVIDLVIEGYTQTLNNYVWTVELSCSPAQPWTIGVYDDSTYRYDAVAVAAHDLGETDEWLGIVCADRLGFYSYLSVPYTVRAAGQLNRVLGCSLPDSVALADGTFETYDGSYGWRVAGGTAALPALTAAGQGHRGQYAVTATATGSSAELQIRSDTPVSPPSAPGQQITVTLWAKRSTAGNISASIDWNGSGGYLSTSTGTVAASANTWTQVTVSGTAPANTTRFDYGATLGSTPAAGVVMTVDDVDAVRTDAQNSRQLVALERAIDGFAKPIPFGSPFRITTPAKYGL